MTDIHELLRKAERERDEARVEIARMHVVESEELRDLREQVLRLGRERDEARAEVERLLDRSESQRAELARLRAAANERAIAFTQSQGFKDGAQ